MGRISTEEKQRNERLTKLQEILDKAIGDLQVYVASDVESPSRERAISTLVESTEKQIARIKSEQAEEVRQEREDERDAAIQTVKALAEANLTVESVVILQAQVHQLIERVQTLEADNHKLTMNASEAEDKTEAATGVINVFMDKITAIPAREALAVHIILAVGRQKAKPFLDKWELGSWCLHDDNKSVESILDAVLDGGTEAPYYVHLLRIKHKMANPIESAQALATKRIVAKQAENRERLRQHEAEKLEADMKAERIKMEQFIEMRDRQGYIPPEPAPTHDCWGSPLSEEILPL